jgi:hypothetical protein
MTRRRPYWRWIALCAVIALAVGGGLALASHYSGTGTAAAAQSSGTIKTTTTEPGAQAVVEAYFNEINKRDWSKVWQLGGKNLSPSHASMVDGFQDTSRDVITHITAASGEVTVLVDAYEKTGAMQVYRFRYTVAGGEISGGSRKLIARCPQIQFGDDNTAGPLFCSDRSPNPPVLAHYQQLHLRVLGLGADATPTQAVQAMCSDLRQHSSYPIETAAYDLAQRINRWSFGFSPPQEMLNGGCG